MSAYSELKQVSIAYAMQAMADLVVPSGSEDKVLLIPISLSGNNHDLIKHYGKHFTIVIYRPMNYCFVGMVEDSPFDLKEGQIVHFETYHDSCWRDGIDRMIKKAANEIYEEAEKDGAHKKLHVFNSFGISSPKVIDGKIIMENSSAITATFAKEYLKVES